MDTLSTVACSWGSVDIGWAGAGREPELSLFGASWSSKLGAGSYRLAPFGSRSGAALSPFFLASPGLRAASFTLANDARRIQG